MDIIFAGTPEFAVPTLNALIKHGRVCAVVTQADKPTGRGQKIRQSPVKATALSNGITVFEKPINLLNHELQALRPDLLVVTAYGHIVSKEILAIPRLGAWNLHTSLLPRYRGAAPMQSAILNNDSTTGITLMHMTPKLDAGPIIAQDSVAIAPDETTGSLHDKLKEKAAELIIRVLNACQRNGPMPSTPQDEALATYTKKITPHDGIIDVSTSAEMIERKIRAFHPWPGAYIKVKNERLKIFKASIKKFDELSYDHEIGSLLIVEEQLVLVCNDNFLVLEQVQREGRKRMSGEAFIHGYLKNLNNRESGAFTVMTVA